MMLSNLFSSPAISVAFIGIIGSILFSLKEIPVKTINLVKRKLVSQFFFIAHIPDFDDLFPIIEKWLFDHHSGKYNEVKAFLQENSPWEHQEGKSDSKRVIGFKSAPNVFSINYKGKTILIEKGEKKIDHARDFRSLFAYQYTLSGYRAKKQITSLLNLAQEYYYKDYPQNAVTIKTHSRSGYFENQNVITVKPINKIILDPLLKEMIIKDIDDFINDKQWYENNSIPYKRGYGFYGPPGTGKTSISLAIASYIKSDVFVINLNSLIDDSALQVAFNSIRPGSVLLLEDIDSSFNGRDSKCKISFSALLNCLDGAFYKEGLITCITTNHLERLDPALLRSGRCDLKIEIPYPGGKEVTTFLSQFYRKEIQINNFHRSIPMAEIQEICIENKNNYQKAVTKILYEAKTKSTTCGNNGHLGEGHDSGKGWSTCIY